MTTPPIPSQIPVPTLLIPRFYTKSSELIWHRREVHVLPSGELRRAGPLTGLIVEPPGPRTDPP